MENYQKSANEVVKEKYEDRGWSDKKIDDNLPKEKIESLPISEEDYQKFSCLLAKLALKDNNKELCATYFEIQRRAIYGNGYKTIKGMKSIEERLWTLGTGEKINSSLEEMLEVDGENFIEFLSTKKARALEELEPYYNRLKEREKSHMNMYGIATPKDNSNFNLLNAINKLEQEKSSAIQELEIIIEAQIATTTDPNEINNLKLQLNLIAEYKDSQNKNNSHISK